MAFLSLTSRKSRFSLSALASTAVFLSICTIASAQTEPATQSTLRLQGHIAPIVRASKLLGRTNAEQTVRLALVLPLQNQNQFDLLLARLYDPSDVLYGRYLTPKEFAAYFAPSEQDYALIIQYAESRGFRVVGTHSNRLLLDVEAPAALVEKAFQVQLNNFRAPDGHEFHSPSTDPAISTSLSGRLKAVVGLDNAAVLIPHKAKKKGAPYAIPRAGSGPAGGFTPNEFRTAYNLTGLSQTGTGQTLALYELDGYHASDITAYENYYGLTHTPLQNVLVDGFSGSAGSGADEVTLDIELMVAVAPNVSKIVVYEGPNTTTGALDTYNRIATDNTAKAISSSWGLPEASNTASSRSSENTIFQQMASQGQSIYAAAGDSGAYDNGSSLSVDDPASQPYVVGVGGTTLTLGTGNSYGSETVWSGGGGGISIEWSLPSYQSGVITGGSQGSTTKRNVPDVSLNADPNTGYSIYSNGAWTDFGGTSCAAPIWAAFTGLVNQQRASNGLAPLGFPNSSLYTVGKSSSYTSNYHDITSGNNQYYNGVAGYDVATGWGSFKATTLLASLAGGSTGTAPSAPTGLTATSGNGQVSLSWTASSGATSYTLYRSTVAGAETSLVTGITGTGYTNTGLTNGTTYYYKVAAVNSVGSSGLSNEVSATPTGGVVGGQLLGNPGFENGSSNPAPWVVSSGVVDNSTGEAAHGGTWKAWLDGYGSTHTDSLYQTVTLPVNLTTATLSFYLHIDTAETTTTTAYDTLKVQIRNGSGTVLATLGTYSNLNKGTGFVQKSFNLSSYKGQTIQIYLVGSEDSSLQTSFVVDDFALNVQ